MDNEDKQNILEKPETLDYEARHNLLGAFEVLNRIYIRLENEAKERERGSENG